MQKANIMSRRFSPMSLAGQPDVRTVMLSMAGDRDRAARIGELKRQNPRLTWAAIAREVGVAERTAVLWQKTGAIKPENAEALARVFCVDFDYIWTGPRPGTPEMYVDRRAGNPLTGELEERIGRIEDTLETMSRTLADIRARREGFIQILAEQQRVLEAIAGMLGQDALAGRAEKAVAESIERAREGLFESAREELPSIPGPAAADGTTETHRSPRA